MRSCCIWENKADTFDTEYSQLSHNGIINTNKFLVIQIYA